MGPQQNEQFKRNVIKKGLGFTFPADGSRCTVKVCGSYDGEKFDEREVRYTVGKGDEHCLIPGIDLAVLTMKMRECTRFTFHPDVAFGEDGKPEWGIPPDSEVDYEITLLEFRKDLEPSGPSPPTKRRSLNEQPDVSKGKRQKRSEPQPKSKNLGNEKHLQRNGAQTPMSEAVQIQQTELSARSPSTEIAVVYDAEMEAQRRLFWNKLHSDKFTVIPHRPDWKRMLCTEEFISFSRMRAIGTQPTLLAFSVDVISISSNLRVGLTTNNCDVPVERISGFSGEINNLADLHVLCDLDFVSLSTPPTSASLTVLDKCRVQLASSEDLIAILELIAKLETQADFVAFSSGESCDQAQANQRTNKILDMLRFGSELLRNALVEDSNDIHFSDWMLQFCSDFEKLSPDGYQFLRTFLHGVLPDGNIEITEKIENPAQPESPE